MVRVWKLVIYVDRRRLPVYSSDIYKIKMAYFRELHSEKLKEAVFIGGYLMVIGRPYTLFLVTLP